MMVDGLPPTLVGRLGRLGALIAADPTKWKTNVAGSVRALIERGLRSMRFGLFKQVSLAALGAILIGGALLYAEGGSGRDGPRAAGPAVRQAVSRQEVPKSSGIPAPSRLKVVSGRGRTELYAIGENGRIPAPAGDSKGPYVIEEREIRWAAIVGTFDHRELRQALTTPGHSPLPPAERLYARVELERQTRREDGAWSNWEEVDAMANLQILDRVRAVEAERVALSYRVDNLLDPLPWLTVGRWMGVDVEEFLPPEKKGGVERPLGREERPIPPHAAIPRIPKERPPALMIRALDFTAASGRSCRYRARVVLWNLDYPAKRQGPRWRFGPWSDATEAVTIP